MLMISCSFHFCFIWHPRSVLRQAFDPPNEPDPTRKHEYFSSDIPVLLHKHMFRHFLLNETELDVISARTDILWLFAVRSPCEWAEAMKRIPWHMCHPDNIKGCPTIKFIGFERKALMKNYTLEEFFQMPWGYDNIICFALFSSSLVRLLLCGDIFGNKRLA
eukprot:CCRYP_014393-RA/>CCRYP_014393-RA protein AED:0.01 eAED:0.01 QI:386/1/1/1/0/0/3/6134/161